MKTLIFSFCLIINLSVYAQDFDKAKMDSLFAIIDANQKGMGNVSIFQSGQEMYSSSFGYADVENNIKNSDKTKFRIGSISKTFTATIVMQLVDERKLTLDTKLSEYFPEIKNAEKITVEHLLRHRSGIFSFTNAPDFFSFMQNPITKSELLNKIASYVSIFEPNERAEYSNSNYVLLSYIAEKIENKEFAQLLDERIAKPCGLGNTYYGSKINTANHEAQSYTKSNSWELASETDMSVPVGAGAIVSNPRDVNIFFNCLFENKLVSESSLQAMKKTEGIFGMGIFVSSFYGKTGYGHTGGIDGFQSMATYFPTEKVSIAFTSNGTTMGMNDILIGALSIYFGREYELPKFTEAIELKTEDLDQYLGTYSSPTFPLKVTFTKKENKLIGQASGQSSFPLEPYEEHKFRFEQAGLRLEFDPDENKVILRQGGGEFELTKEM